MHRKAPVDFATSDAPLGRAQDVAAALKMLSERIEFLGAHIQLLQQEAERIRNVARAFDFGAAAEPTDVPPAADASGSRKASRAPTKRLAYQFTEGMRGQLGIGTTKAYELLRQGRVRTYCVGRTRFVTHDALLELLALLQLDSERLGSA